MENILILTGVVLGAIGVIGSIIPALPGPVLSYIGLFLLYFARGGDFVSEKFLFITGVLVAIILILSNLIPIATVKISGASRSGLVGSIIGTIAGLLLFPPLGIFIGAMLGAMIGEFYSFNDFKKAISAGFGSAVGVFFVLFIQLAFSFSIFIYIVLKILKIL